MGMYSFPITYMESDIRCLRAAQLDFPVMVRRRLRQLSGDRLSAERVARLRPDNPEIVLMKDLVNGMKVHLPDSYHALLYGARINQYQLQ